MDIKEILEKLAKRRPVFHSEHDFKFELAWEIKSNLNDASIRLEYPYRLLGLGNDHTRRDQYLDVLVKSGPSQFFLELKYLTRYFSGNDGHEQFQLMQHGAYPNRSYDVIKDISRIEQAIEKINTTKAKKQEASGFVIVLTNDPAYYMAPGQNALYANFALHDGREVAPGALSWGGEVRAAGRGQPINVRGNYKFCWTRYSQIGENERGAFKVLVVPITCGT